MAEDLISFQWMVRANGNFLVQEDGTDGPAGQFLTNTPTFKELLIDARFYSPLDSPGLFRRFASVSEEAMAIKEFSDQYGLLWDQKSQPFLTAHEREMYLANPVRGERISAWIEEIRQVRKYIDLWDAVRSGSDNGIESTLKKHSHDGSLEGFDIYAWSFVQTRGREMSPRDLGLSILLSKINERLKNCAAPGLAWPPGQRKADFVLVPRNLLGAIWIQFALDFSGTKMVRRCAGCEEWFYVTGDQTGKRSDAQHCSEKCVFRAYRKRQKRAVELHAEGKPIADIAAELGSDPVTVAEWINKKGVGHGKKTK